MSRGSRLLVLLALTIALLLVGCEQEKEDPLAANGAGEQASGEVVVGTDPGESEAPPATPGEEAPVEEPPTVTSEGSIGEGESGTVEGLGDIPSTPEPEETVVAVEEPTEEATPEAATTEGEGEGEAATTGEGESGEASGTSTYTVVAGDTLFSVASQFGTSVDELRALNNLESNFIFVGQELTVPGGGTAPSPPPGGAGSAGSADGTPAAISGQVTYTVQQDEWLYLLARRFNTSVAQIQRDNGLVGERIFPGQQLVIQAGSGGAPGPREAGQTYTVVAGDTLGGIAQQLGTTVEALRQRNRLPDNNIYVGQLLLVP